jgi:hypothetical protein
MRKLSWTLLLPFLLLFAQQGELSHEYSHYRNAEASCKKAPAGPDHCSICLAYAHITGGAKTEMAATPLLTNLAFHFAPTFDLARDDSEAVSPRSRGPPTL